MSRLSLRPPQSLHQKIHELAEREDISINQFIATAVAEKAAALLTVDFWRRARAKQAHGSSIVCYLACPMRSLCPATSCPGGCGSRAGPFGE